MITGLVIGSIHSTIHHPSMSGKRLMMVEKTDLTGAGTGSYLIAVDTVGAGVGEPVLMIDEGGSARQVLNSDDAPIRSVIIGIIDQMTIG